MTLAGLPAFELSAPTPLDSLTDLTQMLASSRNKKAASSRKNAYAGGKGFVFALKQRLNLGSQRGLQLQLRDFGIQKGAGKLGGLKTLKLNIYIVHETSGF